MISIVIPSYNHCNDLLKPCLESIIKYTDLSVTEVIVSANGCKDNTKEYVESLGSPFKLAWSDEAIGFSRAVNAGIEQAQGDYIILLNNDILLLDQKKNAWFDELVKPFKEDPRVGISGPLKCPSAPAGRDFVVFFCAMIKREVFDKIGLLDTVFGVGGGEDTDFCIRAENAGFKVVQVPSQKLFDGGGFMVGDFPIYHKGEGTVHDPNCVTGWKEIFDKNSRILAEKYNYKWRLSNDCERAVIGKDDPVPLREHTRYSWAKENIAGKRVLEIGCSSGYGWRYFKDIPGIDYLGIDKDSGVIEFARENFGNRFQVADINDFDFGLYDTIVAFEVLEHLENGKELAQRLKQHCLCLLVTVPFKEIPGRWGRHHKLHGLEKKDFPGFDIWYISVDGKIVTSPDNFEGLNLLIMKWEKGKVYEPTQIARADVTAVVSTRNRYFTTLPLVLSAVATQTVCPQEIIIYDDGEKKDLREEDLYKNIFALLNSRGIGWKVNFGEGRGQVRNHNASIDEATTKYIWRLDDDNIPQADCLEVLLNTINSDETIGAVGGLVLDPKTNLKKHPLASSLIEDIFLGLNIQWYELPPEIIEVDHLYSTFLYRKDASKHRYCLELSRVGHREETIFTYEMKRQGWKILVDTKARTYHLRAAHGGIRDKTDESFWVHDEMVFVKKMLSWKVSSKDYKVVILDNGLGDHFIFKKVLPDLINKHGKDNIIIAACYPDVFEDSGVRIISISESTALVPDKDDLNIYKWMLDHNWKKTVEEAYRELYQCI